MKQYIPKETRFLQRPVWLDGDLVKGFDIYRAFINTVDADVYVLAHTTSPFIKVESCQKALDHILSGENDSAFSAERIQTFAWYNGNPINYDLNDVPRTQDAQYLKEMSGSIYDYLYNLIESVGNTFESIGIKYRYFEEAKRFYLVDNHIEGDSDDVKEFNALMEYIYIGRKTTETIE